MTDGQGEDGSLIDGAVTPVAGGRMFAQLNRVTEEMARHAPLASAADVDRAITTARRALEGLLQYVETKTIALPVR